MPNWASPGSIVDPNGYPLYFSPVAGGYQLPITPTPSILFADNFNGTTIDTTYRWATAVTAGGGTMTQASGNLVATTSTTANNAAAISTMETFIPSIGNLTAGTLLQVEASLVTNTNRCIGFYTRPGSFTAATPVQDGYVWEIDTTGAFGASIYNGGTRVYRQTFALTSTYVPVSVSFQGLNALFYMNDFTKPILTVPVIQPSVLALPFGFHCINHTSGPGSAPTWQMYGVAVIDSSGSLNTQFNGQAISRVRSPGRFISLNATGIAAETTIWTPASGRKFRILGYVLTSGTVGGNVLLKDNTAGSTILVLPFGAANSTIVSPPMGNGIVSLTANNVLTATGAATQTLSGYIFGCEE